MTREVRSYPPQKLCAAIRNRLKRDKPITVGEIVSQGLDKGTEFSFIVNVKDGSELLVSVLQTKPPETASTKGRGDLNNLVNNRQSEYFKAYERRRKKFLGELD